MRVVAADLVAAWALAVVLGGAFAWDGLVASWCIVLPVLGAGWLRRRSPAALAARAGRLRAFVAAGLAVVVLANVAVTAAVGRRAVRVARAERGARLVSTTHGRMQVRIDGPAGAPALVLLHGWSCSLHWWDAVTPTLARTHRVIRMDLLGFGGSDKPDWSYAIADQGRAVAEVLRKLHVRDAVVAGHSMGATVAVAAAEAAPGLVRGLVVLDMEPGDEGRLKTSLFNDVIDLPVVSQYLRRVTPDWAIRLGIRDTFSDGSTVPGWLQRQGIRDYRRATYTALARAADAIDDYEDAEPLDARLRRLALPATVLLGTEDPTLQVGDAARAYRRVPGARVEYVRGSGHSPQIEQPALTARLLASAM